MRRVQVSLQSRPFPEHWRSLAVYWGISPKAQLKLEWMIFYYTVGEKNASFTAKHFDISRKTFHKWLKRFNPKRIQSLEEHSRIPKKIREWEVTDKQEENIKTLRNKHVKWGKKKLKIQYQKEYGEEISTWKIERVIRKHHLYPDPEEHKRKYKRKRSRGKKVRINHFDTSTCSPGTLWHTDCIILNWYGTRRVIITALGHFTRLGYARVYNTNSSRNAADFLKRLVYLSGGDIQVIHHDNGAEFEALFKQACEKLAIQQVYSRVKTPNDNAALERFNWTVQDEWLSLSETGLDEISEANHDLTNWLIEYNRDRPHQSLEYDTPMQYAQKHYFKVLPMWSASTAV